MFSEALFAGVTGDAGVAALIDTRLFPQKGGPGETYPAATYLLVDDGSLASRPVAGAASYFRTRWQIDAYGRTNAEAEAVAGAIREALDGRVNLTWAGQTVRGSLFLGERSGTFDPDATLHRIIQEYRISFAT